MNAVFDDVDKEIIAILMKDGRISFRDLGKQVNLSANAAAERVRRLVRTGVVTGFHANVDHARLGRALLALIDLRLSPGMSRAGFESAIRSVPGVLHATLMTGKSDYQLRIACKNAEDLDEIIGMLREKTGIQDTYSRLVLREIAL
jgi:Lrp/AsnC family transcriptional regulator, leucine-responsive regulatory protein